jgi:tetratricopeptide (TPR) repeat protein
MTEYSEPSSGSTGDPGIVKPADSIESLLRRTIHASMYDPPAVAGLAADAEEIAAASGDERSIALAAIARAWSDVGLSRFAEALEQADRAAGILARIGDRDGEAEALNTSGRIRIWLGEPSRGLVDCGRALELAVATGNRAEQCDGLCNRGIALGALGDHAASLELCRHASSIAHELGDSDRVIAISMSIGSALGMLGRYHEALEEFRRGLAMATARGNVRFEAQASSNAGAILERLGDLSGALDYHHRALDTNQRLGERSGLAATHNNIAIIYQRLGELAAALEHLLKSLAISEEIGDQIGEMTTLANIGGLYELLGAHGRVLEYYQRSRAIAERIGSRQGEANALLLVGRYHLYARDLQGALLHLFRALRIYEQSGDMHGRTSALLTIGSALRTIGDPERSGRYLEQAIEQAAGHGEMISELVARAELGRLRIDRGEPDEAIAILEQVLDRARAIDARELMRRAHEGIAEAHRANGNTAEASTHDDAARELLRTMFDSESSRRISEMMSGFERSNIEMLGAEMGVSREDLDEIAMVLSHRTAPIVTPREQEAPKIRVTTFGALGVIIGDRELTAADWKRKRPRDLFKLLLLHYRRPIPLDTIVETLGGEIGSRGAELVVMNAVSHIRRALEPERAPRDRTTYLRLSEGAYLLDLGKDADIDFIRFKELVASARRAGDADERRASYEKAIALYRDDFLKEDYDAPWTDVERSSLRDAWLEALEFVAGEQLRQERFEEAVATARRILGHDGVSARAFEVLLEGLVRRGKHVEARRAATSMERAFREALGVAPPTGLVAIVARNSIGHG